MDETRIAEPLRYADAFMDRGRLGWRQIRLARTIEFQFPGWFVTDEVKKACERTTQIEGITANQLRGQYRYERNGGKLPLVWLCRSGKSTSRYGFQRRARHAKFCGILVRFASKWGGGHGQPLSANF